MFPDSTLGACFLPCEVPEDCRDIAPGQETCGASDGTNLYCFVICDYATQCPCGMECKGVEETEYFVCAPP